MDHVLFMDESGDHGLEQVSADFPVLCVAGCIFERDYYHRSVRPQVDAFKRHYWQTTDMLLHSRDIRRRDGAFSFLHDDARRVEFYTHLNALMSGLRFTILAVAILKPAHIEQYGVVATHPYHIALQFLMERYALFLARQPEPSGGYIMAESRGKTEDALLKREYRRLREQRRRVPMDSITSLWMEKKSANIVGLQIADLVAYPIAAKVLRPESPQLAFDVLAGKIDAAPWHRGGGILGYGLKIFPYPTAAHVTLWG